jgi:DNA-binding MarR family transcriptional regulator
LNLSIEHRAAPGADRLQLTLKTNPPALALELMNQQPAESQPTQPSARQRIEQILAEAKTPLSQRQLRDAARIRTSHVAEVLAQLVAAGRVTRSSDGYRFNR